jgi:hypothetical protein
MHKVCKFYAILPDGIPRTHSRDPPSASNGLPGNAGRRALFSICMTTATMFWKDDPNPFAGLFTCQPAERDAAEGAFERNGPS